MLHFLIELQKGLQELKKDEYRDYASKLFVILDNASIHRTTLIDTFFRKKGLVAVTLPQYTPDFNPIEKMFWSVKHHIQSSNLYNR